MAIFSPSMRPIFHDGEEIEQRLGRVFTHAVAGVDDRLSHSLGGHSRRAYLGVAQTMRSE
jgi:hypothetical protein